MATLVKITQAFLDEHRTPNGGWTRAQLEVIGVKWPGPRNWQHRIVGQEITCEQADQFIAAAGVFAESTIRRQEKNERKVKRRHKRDEWRGLGVSLEKVNETLAIALEDILKVDHINAAKSLAEMALQKAFG